MIKPLLIAALFLMPSLVSAQDTPNAPSPSVSTTMPDVVAPQMEAPVTGFVPPNNDTSDVTTSSEPNPVADQTAALSAPLEPPLTREEELMEMAQDASDKAAKFLRDGGPSIWAIAALSVITLALILWKIWRLALIGAWSRGKAGKAVLSFERGDYDGALQTVQGRRGIRSRVLAACLTSLRTAPEGRAREETARVAKRELASARVGLGALELISTIAPLLGLLGTVLGMIAAFQALQSAGSKADPALLAGGIWEALLTTAAGMAVAIPASAALTWFEAVIERIRQDIEDSATRLFVSYEPDQLKLAAE